MKESVQCTRCKILNLSGHHYPLIKSPNKPSRWIRRWAPAKYIKPQGWGLGFLGGGFNFFQVLLHFYILPPHICFKKSGLHKEIFFPLYYVNWVPWAPQAWFKSFSIFTFYPFNFSFLTRWSHKENFLFLSLLEGMM